jgi:hypothetical protein
MTSAIEEACASTVDVPKRNSFAPEKGTLKDQFLKNKKRPLIRGASDSGEERDELRLLPMKSEHL